MYFFYNIAIYITDFILKIVALFNKKIAAFVKGRKGVLKKLKTQISINDTIIWFHCASLGEFEQGRPVIEKLKYQLPNVKILVTFFSPSGYEVRKNYAIADSICYLPFDTKSNVKKFIKIVRPKLAVFVKYEFWPNLLYELQQKNIHTILISGAFRKEQVFFKWYGKWMRKSLKTFNHFFVQNETSKNLLENNGLNNITISGDTRFDRVYDILSQDNSIKKVEEFIENKHILVAGSTWQEDEDLLLKYINNSASKDEKFIIAPHNINLKAIANLKASFTTETVLFSEKGGVNFKNAQVLIIDSVGILTNIYSYATVSYIGGGFTKDGVHNVLEPAVFGIPIIIGPNYSKFTEAIELVENGACISIHSKEQLTKALKDLFNNKSLLQEKGVIASKYVKQNVGATDQILNYIKNQL